MKHHIVTHFLNEQNSICGIAQKSGLLICNLLKIIFKNHTGFGNYLVVLPV